MEEKNVKIPKPFAFSVIVLAAIVFIFAIANGNQPVLSPDLADFEADLEEHMVSSEWLANSLVEGDALFRAVSLRDASDCETQLSITSVFECYDQTNLMDSKWLRKTFRNIDEPLVIIGTETEDGLSAAAKLKYWRYNDVAVLEGGFNDFEMEYLMPEYAEIDITEADSDELRLLAIYRYFSKDDPLVKREGQNWAGNMTGEASEDEEIEGVELGDDEEEEDDDWDDFDDYDAEEGC